MIVTLPCFFAVTSPDPDTVAMFAAEVDHVITRPESVVPFELLVTAVACVVLPTPIDPEDSDTDTVDTDCGSTGGMTGGVLTTIDETALLPSAVAAIFACPALSAFTTPLDVTVAIVSSLDDQKSSGGVAPAASTCASSASVPPTTIVAFG